MVVNRKILSAKSQFANPELMETPADGSKASTTLIGWCNSILSTKWKQSSLIWISQSVHLKAMVTSWKRNFQDNGSSSYLWKTLDSIYHLQANIKGNNWIQFLDLYFVVSSNGFSLFWKVPAYSQLSSIEHIY